MLLLLYLLFFEFKMIESISQKSSKFEKFVPLKVVLRWYFRKTLYADIFCFFTLANVQGPSITNINDNFFFDIFFFFSMW
jgi:hypothetical protein